jgi:hypothetical protein
MQREEHRLRVFENRVLRRMKLHSEKLHILYSSPNIIRQIKSRRLRWVGHVARIGEERKVYTGFCGKARRKKTTSKTKASMGVWDQNGCFGDWLGECRMDQVDSG